MSCRMIAAALVIAALPAAAHAQAGLQGQYDLHCTVDVNDTRDGVSTSTLDDLELKYRVDTVRGVYCEEDCAILWPIREVTSTSVVFDSSTELDTLSHLEYRADGSFRSDLGYWSDARIVWRRGRCERQAFSGFPSTARDRDRTTD